MRSEGKEDEEMEHAVILPGICLRLFMQSVITFTTVVSRRKSIYTTSTPEGTGEGGCGSLCMHV